VFVTPPHYTLSLLILIILHLSAWIAAGLLTSRVVSSSQDALYKPWYCGSWPDSDANSGSREHIASTSNHRSAMQRSNDYALNCKDGLVGNGCNLYDVQPISYTINTTYSCPLPNSPCWRDLGNLQLDTGYINSNVHLGINTREKDSVSYRKITTCAPFDLSNWQSDWHKGPYLVLPEDTASYIYLGVDYRRHREHR
jgi:hypothetical protein